MATKKSLIEQLEMLVKDDERYQEIIIKLSKENKELQEENKRLKEYQESYRKELDYWRIQFSNNKDRIDKAIEYIKCGITGDLENDRAYVDENALLDILRGE